MTFKAFISQLPKQDNDDLNKLIALLNADSGFPDTEDIRVMAEYLYLKLSPELTTAFQQALMLWRFTENDFKQPSDPDLLKQINIIIDLQNDDPFYDRAKDRIAQAKRPRQVICLIPIELPTQEGDVFFFFAFDVFSHYIFKLGMEPDMEPASMLKSIRMLLQDKDFLKHDGQPFTLVLHKYEESRREIEDLIFPHKGKFVVNDAYLAEVMTPVIEHIYKSIGQMYN